MNDRTCENCRWWSGLGGRHGDTYADCRRHAPKVHTQYGPGYSPEQPLWPQTDHNQWCGDHEPHKET